MAGQLSLAQLGKLKQPFYRVAIKALIFDDKNRLLITINEDDLAEIPGGGWENGESVQDCIAREVKEETEGEVEQVGGIVLIARGISRKHKWPVLKIVVSATLRDTKALKPGEDMKEVRFVTKDEFVRLDFSQGDAPIQAYADTIWSGK